MCCSDSRSRNGLLPSLGDRRHQPQLLTSATGSTSPQRATRSSSSLQQWLSTEGTSRVTHSALNRTPGQTVLIPELPAGLAKALLYLHRCELSLCPILPAYFLSQDLIPNTHFRPWPPSQCLVPKNPRVPDTVSVQGSITTYY